MSTSFAKKMRVFISMPNEGSVGLFSSLQFGVSDTIKDVKLFIETSERINFGKQAIYITGTEIELNDNAVLGSVFTDRSELYISLKIKGNDFNIEELLEDIKTKEFNVTSLTNQGSRGGLETLGSVYTIFMSIENLKDTSCASKAEYLEGRDEIAVSLFQNTVLNLFDNALTLGSQDVKYSTGFEDRELRTTLQSLDCATQKFPKRKLEDNKEDFGTALYCIKLKLHDELERCVLYLDSSTRMELMETFERQLLDSHTSAILEKVMDGNGIEDLWRLYALFSRVNNAFMLLQQALSSYIMDADKEKDLVSSLLDFRMSVDMMLEESFSRNDWFSITTKDAFEHLINLRKIRPAELIAEFLDEKLCAGNKGTSEEELEGLLDKVLVLFRFIQGKDVFEALYKKDLARRLLLGRSASIDAEKSMISKLKTECGRQFTNKLEGMIKDIELSKEINESFKQSSQARTKRPSGIEMSVQVLATGYWPTYSSMDVRLPHELNVSQDIFKEFYKSIFTGRRLMWHNSLGHCILEVQFPKGRKELVVSLFQTVVLMLFNDTPKLSFQYIKDSSGIEDKELEEDYAVTSLRESSCASKGREVEDDDYFIFNDGFSAPLFRIKVNSIRSKEVVDKSTTEIAFQDRKYQVDAAIIRIMKAKRVLSHPLLILELFQQLKFPIKSAFLNNRIESLIDRDYLERDQNHRHIYNFVP